MFPLYMQQTDWLHQSHCFFLEAILIFIAYMLTCNKLYSRLWTTFSGMFDISGSKDIGLYLKDCPLCWLYELEWLGQVLKYQGRYLSALICWRVYAEWICNTTIDRLSWQVLLLTGCHGKYSFRQVVMASTPFDRLSWPVLLLTGCHGKYSFWQVVMASTPFDRLSWQVLLLTGCHGQYSFWQVVMASTPFDRLSWQVLLLTGCHGQYSFWQVVMASTPFDRLSWPVLLLNVNVRICNISSLSE